jgi:hypothetical protein
MIVVCKQKAVVMNCLKDPELQSKLWLGVLKRDKR